MYKGPPWKEQQRMSSVTYNVPAMKGNGGGSAMPSVPLGGRQHLGFAGAGWLSSTLRSLLFTERPPTMGELGQTERLQRVSK